MIGISNPILEAGDPFVLLHNGTYYLYSTTENDRRLEDANSFDTEKDGVDGFQVYRSEDLQTWENMGYCLKKGDAIGEKWFWAPEVTYYRDKFYMVYAADEHIAIAVSDSPLGPFRQTEKRWLREGRSIDAHILIDGENIYLYYVRLGGGNKIFVAKMSDDLMSIEEEYEDCLVKAEEPWETVDCIVAEGPFVLKHKGLYYLSYSCNHTRNKDYAVGYAVSSSPRGPFKKYKGNPILHKTDSIFGVGHHSFTTSRDGEQLICVYHCHNTSSDNFKPRMFCIDIARFVSQNDEEDILIVDGPTYDGKK